MTRTDAPRTLDRFISRADADAFGAALDALRQRTRADLGAQDLRYLRGMMRWRRRLEYGGRAGIHAGVLLPPLWLGGVTALALSKILDNMEIGHNVMHGQYDWSGEPDLRGNTYEWNNVCPGDLWRRTHNAIHHRFTNIVGLDRDVGYGFLRVTEAQPWRPWYLLQPVSVAWLALNFEWGVALHDLELDQIVLERRWHWRPRAMAKLLRKAARTKAKDYLLFPLLAGPFFLPVLAGNLLANVARNLWAFTIIFCGHFPAGVHVFSAQECATESRGEWYVRQVLGSCNIAGGRWLHVMSGHLSHQIEHHLFPNIPAHRYPEMATVVRELCAKYGLPYHSGSLREQFGSTVKRLLELWLPPRPHATAPEATLPALAA